MTHGKRYLLGLAAAGLVLLAAPAQPADAAPPSRPALPRALPGPGASPYSGRHWNVDRHHHRPRPIGWDWWRTYPWSPYNAWQNPYWYPPYNPYYPYPPIEAYPYYPYPGPMPYPMPAPGGGLGSGGR
jgi:hypothetical protein